MFDENIHFALSEAALKIENVHQYAKFLNMWKKKKIETTTQLI
jgi:hypothetical protein